MNVTINLQVAAKEEGIPTIAQFENWINETILDKVTEMTIRIVDEKESATLNRKYRNKSGPTNVISFTYNQSPQENEHNLGDLAICAPLVTKESIEQNKPLESHWAHLTVHGTLHLLGYDHQDDETAVTMEALEAAILGRLGFDNPYNSI